MKNRREKRNAKKGETEEDTEEGADPYEDDENEAAAGREPEMTDREGMEENGDETEK